MNMYLIKNEKNNPKFCGAYVIDVEKFKSIIELCLSYILPLQKKIPMSIKSEFHRNLNQHLNLYASFPNLLERRCQRFITFIASNASNASNTCHPSEPELFLKVLSSMKDVNPMHLFKKVWETECRKLYTQSKIKYSIPFDEFRRNLTGEKEEKFIV